MNLVDRVTNYRSRYGYPVPIALVAEFWWRVEHAPLGERVRCVGYRRRKAAERRGSPLA